MVSSPDPHVVNPVLAGGMAATVVECLKCWVCTEAGIACPYSVCPMPHLRPVPRNPQAQQASDLLAAVARLEARVSALETEAATGTAHEPDADL